MEKLNPFGSLQRAIEILKTTECSSKEKVQQFGQISENIIAVRQGVALATSPVYYGHLTGALGLLLLFCEDHDSSVRMAAEENLSRIVRHCETNGNIVRIQRDLYHEIKKNGHERSLRIALSLFAHYCGSIRPRKARTYAQNLLPCIYSISKRREPALQESLCAFTETFCSQLEGYLTDGEVLKMTELFLEDLASECTTKRRCAAKNTLSFVKGSRNPEFYANNAFNRCIEQLLKCGQPVHQQPNTVLGVMGCFRGILPIVLQSCRVDKAIETYDLCLHFLREGSHTTINATLEVLLIILNHVQPAVRKVLLSDQGDHRKMLLKRKTLKNSIFKINISESLLSSRKSSTDARSDQLLRPGSLPLTSTPTKFPVPTDDRSLASASDIELDSLKSMELDSESRLAPALQLDQSVGAGSSPCTAPASAPAPDTLSLKSQKSTDSIGSFLNTLLQTNSNAAESVTKFFRKTLDKPFADDAEEDRLSMDSMASSHISSNAETVRADLDVTLEIDLDTEPPTVATVIPNIPTPTLSRDTLEVPLDVSQIAIDDGGTEDGRRELFIGAIYDQNLLEFTARLLCSRFLLAGNRHQLIADSVVRVSVKSLSLQIIAACVRLKPELLCLPLEKDALREEFAVVEILNLEDAINELSGEEATACSDLKVECEQTSLTPKLESDLLEMKEDHFGECTSTTYFEYFSPMSLSLDQGLKSKLKSIEENFQSIGNNEKLSRDLDAILSQSEPDTGATGPARKRELLVVPKVITTVRSEGNCVREGDKISVTAVSVSDRKELEDEPQQSLADVLLFYDNADPTLRGNVQTIVGNYLRAAVDTTGNYREFMQTKVPPPLQCFLSEFKLLQIVLKGLSDEIHTVINQSLASVEQFFNAFMLSQDIIDRHDGETTRAPFPNGSGNVLLDDRFASASSQQSIASARSILNQLTTMTNTKYWLVQCKLYDVIVQLDFQCIEGLGLPGYYTRDHFLDQLLLGLGDSDIRVRNHAADRILQMLDICQRDQGSLILSQTVVEDFVNEHILSTFAQPFDRRQYPYTTDSLQEGKSNSIVRLVMYKISNQLLRISDKNLQSGILHFLWLFISKYNPLLYVDLWNEYNMLNVLLSLLLEMSGMTLLDVTLHTHLLQICSHLTIVVFSTRSTSTAADADTLNKFIIHLLKVLNIYHHLFSNMSPIVINRMQKADLFMNSKELQQINCFGYFGGEPIYMKLYHQVRSSLESYRITINADAGTKLFECLRASINALWTLLEMKSISTMTNGMKFVEEVLRYLHSFIALEPEYCVRCTRFLLKFIFQSNFVNRSAEISFFQRASEISDGSEVISKEFFTRYYDFCKPKTKAVSLEIGAYVKLFEPLVISCLKMFGRVQSSVQADILEMLCQLLDFNINYQLLDASSIFVETILKHVEYVERDTVDDAEHLMRQVVRFLFKLSALNRDKPIVTVPKIINICDNLLANHLIRQTAIASVKALSHEVFLLCASNGSGTSSKGFELTECCTQKEVVINMLIKFPEELEVYHILPMIVYSERWYDLETGQDASFEPDVLAALLQALDSGKVAVRNERAYSNLAQLMGCFSANLLLESKTMLRFIEILYSTMSNDSLTAHQRVIHAELIVRNVFLRTEECFLLHHVELYHCKANGTGSSDRSNELVQKATQSLVDILIRYLRECFVRIEELQLMLNSSVEELKFAENTVRRYIQALSSLKTFSGISRVLVEQIPLELICWRRLSPHIARPLTELLVNHGYDSEVVLTLLRNATYNVRNDRLVTLMMEVLLENNPNESKWSRNDVLVLLKSESRLLLQDFLTFLLCQITDDEFCKHIVMAIASNMRGKISSAEFKLLEKSPLSTLRLMTNQLGDLLGAVNIVTSRKAALILGHKLDALLQLTTDSDKETVTNLLPETNYSYLLSQLSVEKRRKFPKLFKSVLELLRHYDSTEIRPIDMQCAGPPSIDVEALKHETIDEAWYLRQVTYHCTTKSYTKPRQIATLIHEIKYESKLINLLSTDALNVRLLRDVLSVAFDNMFRTFCTDCVQYNPHLNYLKVHPMLKVSLIILMRKLKECGDEVTVQHEHCAEVIICFLEYLKRLEHLCLFYIEGKFVDRFVKEHLFKANFFETILTFASVCARTLLLEPPSNTTRNELYLSCINAILHQRALWNELNQNDRYRDDAVLYMNTIYTIVERSLHDSQFPQRHRHPDVFVPFVARADGTVDVYLKAIFLAELFTDRDTMDKQLSLGAEMLNLIQSIGIALLKLDRFYMYALTPTELYSSYGSLESLENGDPKLPKVPIEHLYDIELLELFLKRVNLVGYASRQQFEELLMCLMVLINRTEEDALLVSLQEQREIKNVCLHAVMALLVSCYRYPWIGFSGGKFHHSTRNPTIACDRIGLKKLHNIQLLIPLSNVFYQPNLERRLMITVIDDLHSTGDSSVGTIRFDRNQLALKHFWEIMERSNESDGRTTAASLSVRNWQYFVEKINIDVTSSMQLIYGVLEQLLEDDPSLILPHLLSFCEIIDNREQIRWLNTLLLKLQERIPMEDTLSQQHIIYLLCRLSALLVPSMAELTHLCTIIPSYLKSTQLYIRNATLQGLISLLECLVQTNSSIGSLNDELQLVRNITVNYIIKHGIIEESAGAFSDLHAKLVWTLNFYLIEHTSRFVPDCNLLSNSIISANNILKRTNNLDIYLCILNGLERLVIRGAVPRMLHDKIEKLAIDLVKIDNEMFSLSALKLLVTCIYTSCNEQLESTERCNGIVQDEPDIIVQQIEKIEILFAKIRSTTPQGAKVFGDVLCQLIRDLLPPNEIITKVFKELMMNQPNPDIIATVTYQLFRSAIDASYLPLLQEWLLCSLPNFLAFPQVNKSVWCLTVIFLSASLNPHLIKLLPEVLSLPSYQQLNEREINNFILSAKDFYSRLEPNNSQRSKFKEMFQQHESFVFQSLVRCL
ncbi:huntingtin [Anopheles darlingi]|uniref:huntingtin n=1 Tax=Anopheles darlingi TaxID=43151 RepID=UPI0021006447|nr:huntingtin [Anopheles darlingi]